MLTLPTRDGLGSPALNTSTVLDHVKGDFSKFPQVPSKSLTVRETPSPIRELGAINTSKLDEGRIAVRLDDSLHSGESDSDTESEHEEVALKVSFYVKGSCFRFKDSLELKEKGYLLDDQTLFFPIGISNRSPHNTEVWNLENIPVELLKKTLASPKKTFEINWQDRTVQLHFVKAGTMDDSSVLARIQEACDGKEVITREIKTEADLRFFENRTYLLTD